MFNPPGVAGYFQSDNRALGACALHGPRGRADNACPMDVRARAYVSVCAQGLSTRR
jgi:hypothetical protein